MHMSADAYNWIAIFWVVATVALLVACMAADGRNGPGTL
jgi:hypothetical protein